MIGLFPVEVTAVEVVEHNHFYDEDGKLLFEQLIFWDEDGNVLAWRLVREPYFKEVDRIHLWDKELGGIRNIKFNTFHRTWTQYDPELWNRSCLPVEDRKGL